MKYVCNEFLNLLLVCKDTEPRYRKTKARGFFSTVRAFPLTMCILYINLLKHFLQIFQASHFLTKIILEKAIQYVI